VQANIVAAYADNSQVWGGTILGQIAPYSAIKDPLNFDRIFQIQRLDRDIAKRWNNVTMIEAVPEGEPTFALSISTDVSTVEFPKGDNNTTKKYVTVTNTGNAQVVIDATITGNDTSYFSVSPEQKIIDVGKSAVFEVTTQKIAGSSAPNTDADIYISSIVFDDARAYRTMTSQTVRLGHINNDNSRALEIVGNASSGDIFASMSSVTGVINNAVTGDGNTYNLPTTWNPDSLFDSYMWQIQVSYSGSGTSGTMQMKEGATVRKSSNINYPNTNGTLSMSDMWNWVNDGYSISAITLEFV
jgi:hypothetical protein